MLLALRNDHDCDLNLKMGDFSYGGREIGIFVTWGCIFTLISGTGKEPPYFSP
jgi:hypothetical protein